VPSNIFLEKAAAVFVEGLEQDSKKKVKKRRDVVWGVHDRGIWNGSEIS
jgi:hypothetical protein